MLRELSSPDIAPITAQELLPEVAELARLHHFPQTDSLKESIWRQLPVVAKRLGKKAFKQHLELFLPALFDSALTEAQSHPCRQSAASCIRQLADFIGRGIFEGRLPPDLREAYLSSPSLSA